MTRQFSSQGTEVKRSSYGVAPGGCVCLKESMLQTMHDYAVLFNDETGLAIQINAIAGSEHSANSWHYEVRKPESLRCQMSSAFFL